MGYGELLALRSLLLLSAHKSKPHSEAGTVPDSAVAARPMVSKLPILLSRMSEDRVPGPNE